MDWSSPTSYGWRDDPTEVRSSGTTDLSTIKKTHNMAELNRIQSNKTDHILTPFTTQPSIAYCWYWGCNQVCNSHRYLINRMWLVFSVALCVLHLVNVVMAGYLWRLRPSPTKKQSVSPVPTADVLGLSPSFVVPDFGRRRRPLQPNPSVLQF